MKKDDELKNLHKDHEKLKTVIDSKIVVSENQMVENEHQNNRKK